MTEVLDTAEYLLFESASHPDLWNLRLTLREAGVDERHSIIDNIHGEAHPIVPLPGSSTYHVDWASYASYLVWNETHFSGDGTESGSGRFRQVAHSKLLANVLATGQLLIEPIIDPSKLRHWRVVCLNHVVEVISCDVPSVTVLSAC